ncbi:sodium-dependent neutral amino acid transporter SLC6A17-like [Hypomesus transpacificus]|uniref:sodium-dependent neutral amino acid transporter SLC6A17-like n=1 Tax=Hypomesus transpacificus TaxID=137520 RepID=UPI001F07246C|nr:sodium-dependent neutral amino acid transporter SLC6A17-like [Hypomesus transpacificus]
MQDLEDMLGFRPYSFYFYMWKYVSPLCLTILIIATVVELAISPPGYNAWVEELAQERFQSYPPWALAMCFSLIVVAMLPLPVVFVARQFNLMSDGSNKLSVSYRKGMMKDISNLEEVDETRFILGAKNPGETPSPKPVSRAYLGPIKPLADPNSLSPNSCYGTSYQNAMSPPSPNTPTTPESDS